MTLDMKNFVYYTPTEVVFGKGSESKVGSLVKQFGGKKGFSIMAGRARSGPVCWAGSAGLWMPRASNM